VSTPHAPSRPRPGRAEVVAPIALATAARLPDGMADTPHLVGALAASGVTARTVTWDDAEVDWSAFSMVLTHCTWDYLSRREDFLGWLAARSAAGQLVNRLTLLEATLDKAYLLRLAEAGIEVPPTVRVERGREAADAGLAGRLGEGPLVLKPAVGGGGHEVWRCADAVAVAEVAAAELADRPVVVQAFQRSVTERGEYSAVMVAGRLSHAVVKRPRPGDFRVHRRYGATRATVTAPGWLPDYCDRVLAALGGEPLYARIDFLLPRPEQPVLMEVELLEPDLYLREAEGAAAGFASALIAHARL